MMLKAVLVFLVLIALLGFTGKIRKPKVTRRAREGRIASARKCPSCGTYLVDDAPCSCARSDPPSGL